MRDCAELLLICAKIQLVNFRKNESNSAQQQSKTVIADNALASTAIQ